MSIIIMTARQYLVDKKERQLIFEYKPRTKLKAGYKVLKDILSSNPLY
jgi:hypothetical protein